MKTSISRKGFIVANVLILLLLSLVTAYPILYVLFASLSNPADYLAHQGLLLKPAGFSLEAYNLVLENRMIMSGYLNTIIIVVTGVTFNLFMTSLGAYFLSRNNVLWRNPIMMIIVFTMFFGGGLVPYYLTVKGLHLDNTLLALIIPTAVNTFNLILMRTSFMNIPEEIIESSTMDGATHLTVLFKIVLPLSLPVLAVMVLYYGVGHWNAWFNAMLFIRDRDLYPLQLVLREILVQNNTEAMLVGTDSFDKGLVAETLKYAVIIVATVPILALYPFLQRYFVKGMMIGALKG
ncbi:carbohydrate ABC transporter permease [Paenibacillus sp. PL91]|uniref:carbohydrate ABC transporter permease n=1 Tax=Paenibacillus sp. PL91 TaxID=2729538 RepID=UPI00145EBD26|nr:carbohydrate ABC transporter permease [Paenibacillus sp. PL91]MBC9202193.1 carbohydrate ABC transporter permease [Paenibacillus sp. PL91]